MLRRLTMLVPLYGAIAAAFGAQPVAAREAAPLIPVTRDQQAALGMVVAPVVKATEVPGPLLPAGVVVPNSGLQVVTARASGVIASLAVAVGEPVEVGQTLALLESPAFLEGQRGFLEAIAQRDLARAQATREETLAGEGIVAGRRGLESRAQLREAEARLAEQRRALSLMGASDELLRSLERQREMVSTLTVESPLAGIVFEQFAHVGERVEPGDPVYRLGRIDRLEVEIHAPLEHARVVEVGTAFEIPDSGASGRVVAVGREVHSVDQGVVLRGIVEEGGASLRPGQFVAVRILRPAESPQTHRVPSVAVVRVSNLAWVFVAAEEGFQPRQVEVLGGSDDELVVAGEFSDGAQVAVSGTSTLKALWLAMDDR